MAFIQVLSSVVLAATTLSASYNPIRIFPGFVLGIDMRSIQISSLETEPTVRAKIMMSYKQPMQVATLTKPVKYFVYDVSINCKADTARVIGTEMFDDQDKKLFESVVGTTYKIKTGDETPISVTAELVCGPFFPDKFHSPSAV